MDMGYYGLKVFCCHIFEPHEHFHLLMKNFYCPADSAPNENLPGFCLQIITG